MKPTDPASSAKPRIAAKRLMKRWGRLLRGKRPRVPVPPVSGPVALSDWRLSALVDFIQVKIPRRYSRLVEKHLSMWMSSRELKRSRRTGETDDWITVHDADIASMALLVNGIPDAVVNRLEVSVDFRPAHGKRASKSELLPLYRWLRDTVIASGHPRLAANRVYRKIYMPTREEYRHRRGAQRFPVGTMGTVRWEDADDLWLMRLYIKEFDQDLPVDRPSVRLEVSLNERACADLGLKTVRDWVTFSPKLRKNLSPFFRVADGVLPKLKRVSPTAGAAHKRRLHQMNRREQERVVEQFSKKGAPWALMKRYKIRRNLEFSNRVGSALADLQKRISRPKGALFFPGKESYREACEAVDSLGKSPTTGAAFSA